ncbi:MAG: SDR family NAD(P)-dependent oxidoreductase [Chloroflexota bacterium]
MTNKTILITGGTDGIGKATALQLAKTGDDVTIVGRNKEKGYKAQQEIVAATGANVSFVALDMSILSEVQRFVNEYRTVHAELDYLVHCAGVIMQDPVITSEGFEQVFATQYLSRYCLTEALLPAFSSNGSIIFVSGGNVTDGIVEYSVLNSVENFDPVNTVRNTSRAQSLYTLMLMTEHPKLCIYNYGPGIVKTSIGRNLSGIRGVMVTVASHLVGITAEQAGSDVVKLLNETHKSGWYKKGLQRQADSGDIFATEQRELKQFSDNLLSSR